MLHEVLVRVAQEVVAMGTVGTKIEPLEDPDEHCTSPAVT